jgi:hypothetical protein
MTVMDQVRAGTRAAIQPLLDKEAVNYVEAGGLHAMVAGARLNVSLLSVFYNHARDPELRKLIKDAIGHLSEATIKKAEDLLRAGGARVPAVAFREYPLTESLEIPSAARLDDEVIALSLVTIDGASQMVLLTAMHQCYQPEIIRALGSQLRSSVEWAFRLQQLMLKRGWLPEIAKVKH